MLEAVRHQALALVAAKQGRWDDARAGFRAAIAGFGALERGFCSAVVGLQYEHYLGQRDPDARQAGGDAEALCVAGGGAPFVERYRAAFTVPGAPPTGGTTPAKRPVPVDAEQPA